MTATPEADLVMPGDLSDWASRQRAAGRRLVLTNGCFDLIHPGHIALLRGAAAFGDRLVVGVNSDAGVRKLKGPDRPLMPLADRLAVLRAVRWVAAVTSFDEETADQLIERLRPSYYVKGADYDPAAGGRTLPETATLQRLGIPAVFVPLAPGHASSELISRTHSTT
ncbi:MAG: adenylyltransferase/cytidyltransferase family protein [Chloroflexota bacterium]|nr:adenylyltransferase/cytidyltransferase family protein [Chloroflexota bacterium]MDE2896993.1 adenylyltransferase/cytidyltransferase family protein [Chloroflexota bacterium]